MLRLSELLERAILEESAGVDDVTSAIDNHTRVIINYRSGGKDDASGPRVIEVYVYGLSKAGNPVIRAFQPYGDTTTKVPSWKMFRLDRIVEWRATEQRFSRPADEYYKWLGKFNKEGDKSMSAVFKIARFDGDDIDNEALEKIAKTGSPKLNGEVYKTDTERNIERAREMLKNPITLSDLNGQKKSEPGPKLKPSAEKEKDRESEQEIYKTETERGMESLKKQLENPKKIDLSKFEKPQPETDTEQETEEDDDDLFKTDSERGLKKLADQLANPKKIDLSKIPKR